MNDDAVAFLGDLRNAPVLRVAGVVGLLDKMSQDTTFDEDDRRHVDHEKTALFFDIISKRATVDAKTSSSSAWPADFMSTLPGQTARVLDDCYLWVYKQAPGWELGRTLFAESSSKEQLQELLDKLSNRVHDPLYMMDLQNRVTNPDGVAAVTRLFFEHFIKLGLVERAIWSKETHVGIAYASEEERDRKSVMEWINQSPGERIPKTNKCIREACEELAMAAVGSVDDTVRAQIRAIPDRMTAKIDGIHFLNMMDRLAKL
jgi:hypothetical protein